MKQTVLFLFFTILSVTAFSQTYVKGYHKSNGTYVKGYYKSSSNNVSYDNYSTKGNTNPYTGSKGTKKTYYNQQHKTTNYIQTGSRGGKYYINSRGNKQYIK